jgi:uncharacterized protein
MGAFEALRCAIIVFAKAPVRGTVKTRIAATQGDDHALAIYKELLLRTRRTLDSLHYHVAFTGAPSPRSLEPFFPKAASFFPQQGETLGARQAHAFLHCAALGYNRFCAIGCDCPTLSTRQVTAVFRLIRLFRHVAIGPAEDGGYYLIAGSAACIGLFDVDGWSTPKLLSQTLGAAGRLGLRCRLLEKKSDIDTYDDFLSWKKMSP